MKQTKRWFNRYGQCAARVLAGLVLAVSVGAMSGCDSDSDGGSGSFDFGANDESVVVCCGDSITASGYPSVLAGMVGKTTYNAGVPGQETDAGVANVNAALGRYHPGYLVILYGANDVIRSRDLNAAVANLRTMIQLCKANQTLPIIGTLTPMYDTHEGWQPGAQELNSMILNMASSEGGVRVARFDSAFGSNRSLVDADGLHPTSSGNVVLADVAASRIN